MLTKTFKRVSVPHTEEKKKTNEHLSTFIRTRNQRMAQVVLVTLCLVLLLTFSLSRNMLFFEELLVSSFIIVCLLLNRIGIRQEMYSSSDDTKHTTIK